MPGASSGIPARSTRPERKRSAHLSHMQPRPIRKRDSLLMLGRNSPKVPLPPPLPSPSPMHPTHILGHRYDNYLLLSHLSSEPSFRRCLRAGCENGQIYEQGEYPNPHITCSSCDFEMCFNHHIPWHSGLSCDQYDSQQQHGDPEYQQTRDWMRSNSKNCPGANCEVRIEKGNACFHMTCGSSTINAKRKRTPPGLCPVLRKLS